MAVLLFANSCKKGDSLPQTRISPKLATPEIQTISFNGIGGYNLWDRSDRVIAFDFDHTGKNDYLLCYRPGHRTAWILKNVNGAFTAVYQNNTAGIGGFDLSSQEDWIMPFDFEHSGKKDYLICYRPGMKVVWILKHNGTTNTFTTVYQSTNGIGGYLFDSIKDRMFAYDYEHSGKQDYLVCFREGSGLVDILKNTNGTFTKVYTSGGAGIGGYSLKSNYDITIDGFAWDFEKTGKSDYLAFMQNTGDYLINELFAVKRGISGFTNVYHADFTVYNPNTAVDYYRKVEDIKRFALPYDFNHDGLSDDLVVYCPGFKTIRIYENAGGGILNKVYESASQGIGGFNLDQPQDRVIAFDYEHSGKMDYLLLYRNGDGIITILKNTNGVFSQVL